MQNLLNGFRRFQTEVFPKEKDLFHSLAQGQKPEALFITCADSRVVPTLITQSRPGDLFLCRTVGNQIPPHGVGSDSGIASSIEYGLQALGIRHIIVCGHSDCGAMKAVLHPENTAALPATAHWLRHAAAAQSVIHENYYQISEQTLLDLLTKENILAQINNLKTHPSVAARLARGELMIHGWMYNIERGEITNYDRKKDEFVPLDGQSEAPIQSVPLRFAEKAKGAA